jgi:hypothetical protein
MLQSTRRPTPPMLAHRVNMSDIRSPDTLRNVSPPIHKNPLTHPTPAIRLTCRTERVSVRLEQSPVSAPPLEIDKWLSQLFARSVKPNSVPITLCAMRAEREHRSRTDPESRLPCRWPSRWRGRDGRFPRCSGPRRLQRYPLGPGRSLTSARVRSRRSGNG